MDELQPEDLEELVQELEGESEEEETLSPEVEELLRDLQPDRRYAFRRRAAKELGEVSRSNRQIVQALVTAAETDSAPAVRAMAAESLRAPVHQEILQEYPDLMQHARPASEQAEIQRERQREEQGEKQRAIEGREEHNRKESRVGRWDPLVLIAFGIAWVGASGIAAYAELSCFLSVAFLGAVVVVLGLWRWRSLRIRRDVLLRSSKVTDGTVEGKRMKEHKGEYGTSYSYYVTVCFEAEDAKVGTRVMVLKASVSCDVWDGLRVGESARIRYAAEDPRVALIEGEW